MITCRYIIGLLVFGDAGPLAESSKDSESKLGSIERNWSCRDILWNYPSTATSATTLYLGAYFERNAPLLSPRLRSL
jgi:hypothetical protein